jgi:ribosomal protein L37E
MDSRNDCKHEFVEEVRPALRAPNKAYEYARQVCKACGFAQQEVLRREKEKEKKNPHIKDHDEFTKWFLKLTADQNKMREELEAQKGDGPLVVTWIPTELWFSKKPS